MELSKIYEAGNFERDIYQQWEASGLFDPDRLASADRSGRRRRRRKTFSIIMPPPNTTGVLHLGHASALAYEDTLVRYKRMRGFLTLYVPGTDHAAIATQNRVEKLLTQEGLTRQALGRDKFLERVREFVSQSQGVIQQQIRNIGASCDWSRQAYTFDAVSSRVVTEVFLQLYHDGLIYRGFRIVNWCVRCQSTLADDEVQYIEQKAPFYYLKYGPVTIGTARPETKFLDKVIIVHPGDKRYQHLTGREFDVPWIEGAIRARVIADKAADPTVGSGAMTITPAHSFEDYALAQKYDLPVEQIIDTDGKITAAGGAFGGLTVAEAREKVIAALASKGLVERVDEDYIHNLSVCYRCGTPVEPLLSKQWFVAVNKKVRGKSLAQRATEMVRRRDIAVIPERFRKVYFHWLLNLHDWCISRQIWWGHRIPVWYCIPCHDDPGKYKRGEYWMVGREKPARCPRCGQDKMHQDNDTLDTWFSSATWSFSTLLDRNFGGYRDFKVWVKKSPDIKRFHPTSVLETGYDILFFWVARMVLITSYVMGEKPFASVYLHGMVRDRQGRKMSKSLGNGIDPNEMIAKYGADALRLSLIIGSAPGQDSKLYDEKIAGYRNFVNKLWNIARFIMTSVSEVKEQARPPKVATLSDEWILRRFQETVSEVTKNLEQCRFSAAGETLYKFTWQDLADWYLEISKVERQLPGQRDIKDRMLLYLLHRLLILWHPFAPYATEVIWRQFAAGRLLAVEPWPKTAKMPVRIATRGKFQRLQELVTSIRNMRAMHKIPAQEIIRVNISGGRWAEQRLIIERLARCRWDETLTHGLTVRGRGFAVIADVKASTDNTNQEDLKDYIGRLEAKLANKDFLERAPREIIDQERQKLKEAQAKLGAGGQDQAF